MSASVPSAHAASAAAAAAAAASSSSSSSSSSGAVKMSLGNDNDDDSSSDDDDDMTLMSMIGGKRKLDAMSSDAKKNDANDDDDSSSDDDDDKPLISLVKRQKTGHSGVDRYRKQLQKKAAEKRRRAEVRKKRKGQTKRKKRPGSSGRSSSSSSSSKKAPGKLNLPSKYEVIEELKPLVATKGANKWWNRLDLSQPMSRSRPKWETLVHNGVLFPPPYEPHGVRPLYDGQAVALTPEQEEAATWYAQKLKTDYVNNPIFRKNFFADWRKLLGTKHTIKRLDKVDFTPIWEHLEVQKEIKKQRRKDPEVRAKTKAEKERLKEIYGFALVDGYREQVGNYNVEPPGLFMGRGKHPKSGMIKKRIMPEDVTLNVGVGQPIPKSPVPGHNWKGVMHNQSVTWLAYWIDSVNKSFKYVFLANDSRFKGESDILKYEKARKLKKYIGAIREDYTRKLTARTFEERQLGTAVYLIDFLALRVGNEKDTSEEADTVGCCSLRVEHLKFLDNNRVLFDFLGKDSMRYHNEVQLEAQAYTNLQSFCSKKQPEDNVFDQITTTAMNDYLKTLMPGLSAKVFRTYNASTTLQRLLREGPNQPKLDDLVAHKALFYNSANREVAILCNHQRSVPKGHAAAVEKLQERLRTVEEQRQELQDWYDELFASGSKKNAAIKRNEARKNETTKPKRRSRDKDVLRNQLARLDVRLANMQAKIQEKSDNKEVSLSTSKLNYLDPRITVAWAKDFEVPIEKIFNRSVLKKFPWAMEIEPDWRF